MSYTIRECLASDAMAICKLNFEEMGYSFSPEATQQKIVKLLNRESDKIFVALVDDAVVGYVHACDYDVIYAPHMKNIMGIAVSPDFQHRGIGSALLQQAENWARSTGAAGVRLVSGANRTGAHAFYHKCGYTGDREQLNLNKMF